MNKRSIIISLLAVILVGGLCVPARSAVHAQESTPTSTNTPTRTTTPQIQNLFYTRDYSAQVAAPYHDPPLSTRVESWSFPINIDISNPNLLALIIYKTKSGPGNEWCNYQYGDGTLSGRQSEGTSSLHFVTSWAINNTTVEQWIDTNYPDAGNYAIDPLESPVLVGNSYLIGGYTCSVQVVAVYLGVDPESDCSAVLIDGGMEQMPVSDAWFPSTNDFDNRYGFGRMDGGDLITGALFGGARCEEGYQIVSGDICELIDDWFQKMLCTTYYSEERREASGIHQRFYWSGGNMFYRFSAMARPQGGMDRNVRVNIAIQSAATGQSTYILPAEFPLPPGEWSDYSGTLGNIAPGWYWANVYPGHGNAEFDGFSVDDFQISRCELNGTCESLANLVTPSPTPINSATPTMAGVAGDNLIQNCGFEQGSVYWSFPANTFVVYDIANNYAHLNTSAARPVAQAFTWPGGIAYVRFQSDSAYNVYFRNLSTGIEYSVLSSVKMVAGWPTWSGAVSMPQGPYSINLALLAGAGPSDYDTISVSTGNYASCVAGSQATATPHPTSTPNNTPTMWPTNTQRPTSTVMVGTPTSTPIPSFTPYPTYTPYSTPYPSITPNPFHTSTPYPTYTRQPTYTPYPTPSMPPTHTVEAGQNTSTPWPTYTPNPPTATPPNPPPPPDYYVDCNRPQNGYDIPHWIEYEKCQMLSFFSMSPNAVSTARAVPTILGTGEPFGTLGEVQDTGNRMKTVMAQYDWDRGMPGTKDRPDPSIFLTPVGALTGGPLIPDGPTADPISFECDVSLGNTVGVLAEGMCWFFNFLYVHGITPWLQLLIDLTALITLAVYIWKKWIDAGTF